MRIVGGRYKRRGLVAPSSGATRPTSDRAREAIFNVLEHADWAQRLGDARVIDVFAGAGALGFEALSRGAAFCLFVDNDAAARGAIRTNADALDVMGATRIHRRDATDLGAKPAGLGPPFTLAFLDPPYGKGFAEPTLETLASGGWLAGAATVVVETSADERDIATPGFDIKTTRVYGEAKVTFLTRRDQP